MYRQGRSRAAASIALALPTVAVLAAFSLAACGGSSTTTSNTAASSPAVTVSASSTPAPTPTRTWTPGAKPIPAAAISPQRGSNEGFQSSSNGWEFKPKVDISVTDLGYFDDNQNGLRHSHPVGIFDTDTEKLLVKTTVRRKDPLDGVYRYAKIEPVTLKAGKSYVVATVSYPPFDPEVNGPEGLAWAPEIEYVGYREALTDQFVLPPPSSYEFITAHFKFKPVSAP